MQSQARLLVDLIYQSFPTHLGQCVNHEDQHCQYPHSPYAQYVALDKPDHSHHPAFDTANTMPHQVLSLSPLYVMRRSGHKTLHHLYQNDVKCPLRPQINHLYQRLFDLCYQLNQPLFLTNSVHVAHRHQRLLIMYFVMFPEIQYRDLPSLVRHHSTRDR